MSFKENEIDKFLEIFKNSRTKIKAMDGCQYVELLQSPSEPNVMFTISIWDSEEHLNAYRTSELFINTWAQTKILFSQKAQTWTLHSISKLGDWT